MTELRPLVDEYHELERVAQRLGVAPPAPADSAARPRRTRPRSRPTSRGRSPRHCGRANRRRDQLLEIVKARPGITVREIGTELGVDPTSLYRIVHQLEKDGAVPKRGRELLPG